jgi:hypothetical protein
VQANLPPAHKMTPAPALFSALPARHTAAVSECMELVPELVEVALHEQELISGLCAQLFMSELSGPSVAAILCSYAVDVSEDPGVPLKCVASMIKLLTAAKERGSHDFVPSLLATCVVRFCTGGQLPQTALESKLEICATQGCHPRDVALNMPVC